MNRATTEIAIGISLFPLLLAVAAWGDFVPWTNANQGLAAWVQAFGTFAAILGTGWIATSMAERQEKARQRQLVASVFALVSKGYSVALRVHPKRKSEAAFPYKEFHNPARVLEVVLVALTPARIHDLPTLDLISAALDFRSAVSDLNRDVQEGLHHLKAQMTDVFERNCDLVIEDAEAFQTAAKKWRPRP